MIATELENGTCGGFRSESIGLLRILKPKDGGEGGIRTHVPVTRQIAFEAIPLRPLRYLSALNLTAAPLPAIVRPLEPTNDSRTQHQPPAAEAL